MGSIRPDGINILTADERNLTCIFEHHAWFFYYHAVKIEEHTSSNDLWRGSWCLTLSLKWTRLFVDVLYFQK